MSTNQLTIAEQQWRQADSSRMTDAFHYLDDTENTADGVQWLRVSAYSLAVAGVQDAILSAHKIGLRLAIIPDAPPNMPAFQPFFFCITDAGEETFPMQWQQQFTEPKHGDSAPIPHVTSVLFREMWQRLPSYRLADVFMTETTKAVTNNPPGANEPTHLKTRIRVHRYYFDDADVGSIKAGLEGKQYIYFYPGVDLNKAAESQVAFSPIFRFTSAAPTDTEAGDDDNYDYLKPCPPTCPP